MHLWYGLAQLPLKDLLWVEVEVEENVELGPVRAVRAFLLKRENNAEVLSDFSEGTYVSPSGWRIWSCGLICTIDHTAAQCGESLGSCSLEAI